LIYFIYLDFITCIKQYDIYGFNKKCTSIGKEKHNIIYTSVLFLEIIIYLKEQANLDYSEISLYNITIACLEARTPVEKASYLVVVVEPNAAPVFNNFQSIDL